MTTHTVTNTVIFAGAALLGAEVLQMDAMLSISIGFLLVMLRISFAFGKMATRIEMWMDSMSTWKTEVDDWRRNVDIKLSSIQCSNSQRPSVKQEDKSTCRKH